MNDQVLLM